MVRKQDGLFEPLAIFQEFRGCRPRPCFGFERQVSTDTCRISFAFLSPFGAKAKIQLCTCRCLFVLAYDSASRETDLYPSLASLKMH